jgi:dCTP deaminase
MALSDVEIWAEIGAGWLEIDPPPSLDRVVASSIDLLLHYEILLLPPPNDPAIRGITVDPTDVEVMAFLGKHTTTKDLAVGAHEMKPGEFVIAKTNETITLPSHLAARVEGKSTLGRLGLAVHITAPTVQSGFHGRLTLEMYNTGPFNLKLNPKMKICQLILERLGIPSKGLYKGKFQWPRLDQLLFTQASPSTLLATRPSSNLANLAT